MQKGQNLSEALLHELPPRELYCEILCRTHHMPETRHAMSVSHPEEIWGQPFQLGVLGGRGGL